MNTKLFEADNGARFEPDRPIERVNKDLLEALKKTVGMCEDHIHSEYDGTSYCKALLKELSPMKKLIAKAEKQL